MRSGCSNLPPAVLEMIERGELSAGQARPLLAIDLAEAQLAAARKIVEGRIWRAAPSDRRCGASRAQRAARAPRAAGDPNLEALAEGMQRALKRKVRIVRARGRTPAESKSTTTMKTT